VTGIGRALALTRSDRVLTVKLDAFAFKVPGSLADVLITAYPVGEHPSSGSISFGYISSDQIVVATRAVFDLIRLQEQ
jgi:hypothetical protein